MNNNYDEIDNFMFKYFEDNKIIPKSIIQTIDNALSIKKKRTRIFEKIRKIIITIIGIGTITGGIVFANEISNFIQSIFHSNRGVDTAVNQGYYYEPNNVYSVSENAELRLNEIVMDDYNLNLGFSVKFDKNTDINDLYKIDFSEMCISDESNNILCCNSKDLYKEYCIEKNIQYSEEDYGKINVSENIFIRDIKEGNMYFILNFTGFFPKSKELFIRYKNINLSNESKTKKVCIKGNWNLKLDVPEEFYNRKSIIYNLYDCNNTNIYKNTVNTVTSPTGTKFEMLMKGDLIDKADSEENKKKKLDEIFENSTIENLIIKPNAYIENEKGEKFYLVEQFGSGAYGITTDGNISYSATFNMNTSATTDKITIYLEMYNGEKIIINLSRQ